MDLNTTLFLASTISTIVASVAIVALVIYVFLIARDFKAISNVFKKGAESLVTILGIALVRKLLNNSKNKRNLK